MLGGANPLAKTRSQWRNGPTPSAVGIKTKAASFPVGGVQESSPAPGQLAMISILTFRPVQLMAAQVR